MIDKTELNAWIETDEGRQWADGLKAPLLAKRDELLSALKDANGKLAGEAQRAADADRILADERKAIEKIVVDDALAAALRDAHVFEPLIPSLATTAKELYGLGVKSDGLTRSAAGKVKGRDGQDVSADMNAVMADFLASDMAKNAMPEMNTGGGAPGSKGFAPAATDADVTAFRQAMGLKG